MRMSDAEIRLGPIGAATEEIVRLRADLASAKTVMAAQEREAANLTAACGASRAALEAVTWVEGDQHVLYCAGCGFNRLAGKEQRHSPRCPVAAALRSDTGRLAAEVLAASAEWEAAERAWQDTPDDSEANDRLAWAESALIGAVRAWRGEEGKE